eukprot:2371811-Rhodomonas_salina.1
MRKPSGHDDASNSPDDHASPLASPTARSGSSTPTRRVLLSRFRASPFNEEQERELPKSAVAYLELERRLRAIPIDLTDYSQ